MSAQVTILQLPAAGAITGTEAVPVVQNGVTVQTTTGAIANSPTQTYSYLTVSQTPQLPNSRYVGVTNGLSITDGGAQGLFNISTTGALLSLVSSGTGFQVKTSSTAITGRSIAVSGAGLSIANDDGVSGNPTIALTGQVSNLANLNATGLLTITTAGAVSSTQIVGTSNQVGVTNGNGIGGSPTISIADNVVLPGTEAMTVPKGTNAQQPSGVNGQIRYNTDTNSFTGYRNGVWVNFGAGDGTVTNVSGTANQISVTNNTTQPIVGIVSNPVLPGLGSVTLPKGTTIERPAVPANGMLRYNTDTGLLESYLNGVWTNLAASGSGVISVGSGNGLQGGPITSSGVLSIDTAIVATLTGVQTLTGKTINGANNTVSVTNGLTIGTGLTGSSYNGSAAVTIAIDSTVATLTGVQTLTSKTIDAASNTLSNIPNSSLTNSSVTLGSTSVALGGTTATLGGLTSVAVTQDPVSALQLATKQYVDSVAEGLNVHAACNAATTTTLAATTGGTVTYNNGASGVGATLTLSVALTVLDGYTLVNGNRVLVKNEAAQANNGIYTWATGGTVLTRATDFNSSTEITSGDFTFVTYGTVNGASGWVQTLPVTTVGTSPIVWLQFSGGSSFTAGNGLQLIGSEFSLVSPVSLANGGTGQTSASAAFNALSPITTTGDLILGNGTNSATRLGIGPSGRVLKSTGTTAAWELSSSYLPIILHDESVTEIPVSSGFLPVLLSNGVTTVNVALF